MSELQNPLFEEEKEFLERKKLEYERALRGDVDHIKDQSVMVGKVALVGAGLAGSVWLISKLFSGKKRKRRARAKHEDDYDDHYAADHEHEEADHDYEFGSNYYSSGKSDSQGYDDGLAHKSAAESAQAFAAYHEQTHEADDLGFGSKAAVASGSAFAGTDESVDFDTEEFEEDPFQDLPYDDSRRLPASHAFDDGAATEPKAASSRSHMLGDVLKAFLQTDTGKVLVAQAAAVAMALVTKKIGEFFPADKNADLATSPGYAPAQAGPDSVASPAPSVFSDASNPSQSV